MLSIVQPVRKEHAAEVDIVVVSSIEVSQPVFRQMLDPFGSRAEIQLGVLLRCPIGVLGVLRARSVVVMLAAHREWWLSVSAPWIDVRCRRATPDSDRRTVT
jgi:hypothetical protein